MLIGFDPAKRAQTLRERGLDFADAGKMFEGRTYTQPDERMDYGEDRFVTFGHIDDAAVVIVWTRRGNVRRIISMRRAHAKEMRRVGLD